MAASAGQAASARRLDAEADGAIDTVCILEYEVNHQPFVNRARRKFIRTQRRRGKGRTTWEQAQGTEQTPEQVATGQASRKRKASGSGATQPAAKRRAKRSGNGGPAGEQGWDAEQEEGAAGQAPRKRKAAGQPAAKRAPRKWAATVRAGEQAAEEGEGLEELLDPK